MTEISALLHEDRRFPPSPEWKNFANITDPSVYGRASADPESFWADFARELDWNVVTATPALVVADSRSARKAIAAHSALFGRFNLPFSPEIR